VNVWFSRLVLLALAVALIGLIFSMIPLGNQPRDPPEGIIVSPEAPPTNVTPPEDVE
jgi:hypothetical protein